MQEATHISLWTLLFEPNSSPSHQEAIKYTMTDNTSQAYPELLEHASGRSLHKKDPCNPRRRRHLA